MIAKESKCSGTGVPPCGSCNQHTGETPVPLPSENYMDASIISPFIAMQRHEHVVEHVISHCLPRAMLAVLSKDQWMPR